MFGGIFSFLESIYNSVAESLPDVRDNSYDSGLDPYALLAENARGQIDLKGAQKDKRGAAPKTKAKKHRHGVAVDPSRTVQAGCEVKWLPPGTIKEYWTQYTDQIGPSSAASFPTFWRASQLYANFMLSSLFLNIFGS